MRCQNKQDAIEHKYIGGYWPEVQAAPDPSLIKWENLGKGSIERCGRATFTFIVALLLLVIGFGTILWLFQIKEKYTMNTLKCGELVIDEATAYLTF